MPKRDRPSDNEDHTLAVIVPGWLYAWLQDHHAEHHPGSRSLGATVRTILIQAKAAADQKETDR